MSRDPSKLHVFKLAHELALSVYRVTARLPADERFGLTTQLRRAVVSIPTNIAEGCGRSTAREYHRFLDVARFPEMRFRSRGIYPDEGDRRLTIVGDLTIRDVTREIRIVVEHDGAGSLREPDSKLAFKGRVSVQRLDFGLRWQQELVGRGLVAGDVVDVELRVNARRGAK
jgi:hypothetical protein